MILDKHLLFSDAQAVGSTDVSTNIIDLGPFTNNASRDIGAGEPLFLVFSVQTACTALTAATFTPLLQTHSASGFSANTILYSGSALSSATMGTTGPKVVVRLPLSTSYARFLRAAWTVATGPFTAGNVDVFITKDVDSLVKTYADNVSYS